MDLRIGGKYKLSKKLGSGAVGDIYYCIIFFKKGNIGFSSWFFIVRCSYRLCWSYSFYRPCSATYGEWVIPEFRPPDYYSGLNALRCITPVAVRHGDAAASQWFCAAHQCYQCIDRCSYHYLAYL